MGELAATVRRRRRALGLTMQEVAGRAGISQPFLSQLERGLTRPSMRSLDLIAESLESGAISLLYPFGTRATGRAAITAEWMAEKHLSTEGGYDAVYEPIAVDRGVVVTHGRTLFFNPATGAMRGEFDNIWVLRFAPDGRCAEFHEWYTGRPDHDPTRAMPHADDQ